MNKLIHTIYIYTMVAIVIGVTYYLATTGYSFYKLPLEERFYHPQYDWLKPSGIFGQGLGVVGTGMIAFGVAIYILRKRYGFLERLIRLKYLLEFHIFLCFLGPILIVFHTTFKFGGLVSIAFWSMVAVVISGIIGRFIYIQIPWTSEGRALSIQEVQAQQQAFMDKILSYSGFDKQEFTTLLTSETSYGLGPSSYFKQMAKRNKIKNALSRSPLSPPEQKSIMELVKEEMSLSSKVGRLDQMKKIFEYWHVIHMPFALIMLIIVVIHIAVSITLGYKWIF